MPPEVVPAESTDNPGKPDNPGNTDNPGKTDNPEKPDSQGKPDNNVSTTHSTPYLFILFRYFFINYN